MREKIISLVERYVGPSRPSGDSDIAVRCPFHKGGHESHASFYVNVDKGLYYCHTCHESGTLPKLLKLLGLPQEVVELELKDIRAALELTRQHRVLEKKAEWANDPFRAQTPLSENVLRPFEWCPARLVEAGFHPVLLQKMEIGFDRNNNRITYPIRDMYGNLAGIVGGAAYAGQYPKYKVYADKRDYGPWFEEQYPDYHFRNHDYLWNFERVYPALFYGKEVQTLIIVEGFKACLWLLQNGYPYTVALMGSSLTDKQEQHLQRLQARVVLLLDNNAAGREGSSKIGRKLRYRADGVYIAHYPEDADPECQPDHLPGPELAATLQRLSYPS